MAAASVTTDLGCPRLQHGTCHSRHPRVSHPNDAKRAANEGQGFLVALAPAAHDDNDEVVDDVVEDVVDADQR
eukprot:5791061-Amphidinium_carterae.1